VGATGFTIPIFPGKSDAEVVFMAACQSGERRGAYRRLPAVRGPCVHISASKWRGPLHLVSLPLDERDGGSRRPRSPRCSCSWEREPQVNTWTEITNIVLDSSRRRAENGGCRSNEGPIS
jgi:hypothetical protein